ncbi:MAG: enoyl-CoA hydratase/isomerase family protein [Chromatiales bacterium]|jgi:3-hydroxyacyl-CoA dehydrogenase/enoyl-CoA hydratase/3-hydroxybutyryl-CoA epimerase|nr:enoyl-CoA hydratase/isomerase family protein [Chromatiales bacterium]
MASETGSPRCWQLERDGAGVAWLTMDCPGSANTLSAASLGQLDEVLAGLAADPPAGLVIHSAKPGSFITGADINEFPKLDSAERACDLTLAGQAILARIAALPAPSCAVLNGHALGGGLELALACDWRVGLRGSAPVYGLPEVRLGLHPGFGGTIRATRLLGVLQGLELVLGGRSLKPADARRLGLIDREADAGDWRQAAVELLRRGRRGVRRRFVDRLLSLGPVRPLVARQLTARVTRQAPADHYPAPHAVIALWRRFGAADTPEAYRAEAESFGRLAVSPASRNLVRLFFLQERLKKFGRGAAGALGEPGRRVHVVGAGVMGGDIAAWCALRGHHVTLQDRGLEYIQPALERARKLFAKRLPPDEAAAAQGRLTADVAGDGARQAEFVIEAVFEDPGVKRTVYAALEAALPPGVAIATNTSSIPLEELAGGLSDPGRLVGLHFFNPVAKLPLVEVVQATTSSPGAVEQALAFARGIDKLPLPCRSRAGFLVNRILAPYMAEAFELLREGHAAAAIDRAAVGFGMPMGPVELADSVGLDVALHVARVLSPVVGRGVAPELEQLVAAGHLGRKTGRGFYTYRDGKPVRPSGRGEGGDQALRDRLVMALLNEAAACLHEGIVADADLVDAGVVFGTGFAPFRGGPLAHARSVGIDQVVATLRQLEARLGPRFRPSPGWDALRAPAA